MRTKNTPTSIEGKFFLYGKTGDTLISEKPDRDITALAGYYKRKIKTERMLLISSAKIEPTLTKVTYITIL